MRPVLVLFAVLVASTALTGGTPMSNDVVRIRLIVGDKKVVARLYDNASSRDLVAQLPLTLKLSDYAGTEKVATLPKKLSTKGTPAGFDPSVGDVTYYAPWGNLAIFYKDFGYAKGLVSLGVIESGTGVLSDLDGDTTIILERLEIACEPTASGCVHDGQESTGKGGRHE